MWLLLPAALSKDAMGCPQVTIHVRACIMLACIPPQISSIEEADKKMADLAQQGKIDPAFLQITAKVHMHRHGNHVEALCTLASCSVPQLAVHVTCRHMELLVTPI